MCAFETGPRKSVVLPIGNEFERAQDAEVILRTSDDECSSLAIAHDHKWLGLQWSVCLEFTNSLKMRLGYADKKCSELTELVAANALPLHMAVVIFEAKIDSYLAYGCWLHALCAKDAEDLFTEFYDKCALRFLGAPSWRRAALAHSELGHRFAPYHKVLKHVALRLAKVEMAEVQDFHSTTAKQLAHISGTWCYKASEHLTEQGLPLFLPHNTYRDKGYENYKKSVDSILMDRSSEQYGVSVNASSNPLPYFCVQEGLPSKLLARCAENSLSWETSIGVRSFMRMRVGFVELACKDAARSSARIRACIFCGMSVRNPVVHVMGSCRTYMMY